MVNLVKLVGKKSVELETIDGKVYEGIILTAEDAQELDIDISDNPFIRKFGQEIQNRYFMLTSKGDYINLSRTGHARVISENHEKLKQVVHNHNIKLRFEEVVDIYPSQYALMFWTVGNQQKTFALVNINSPVYRYFVESMKRATSQVPVIAYSEPSPSGFVIEKNGLVGIM